MVAAVLAVAALAQDSVAELPRPVAGHPVLDVRLGVDDRTGGHPVVCIKGSPLRAWSVEACGTGQGILHDGEGIDMAHFRGRFAPVTFTRGRLDGEFALGAGLAEIQAGRDEPGFRLGRAEDGAVEAAGPEVSASLAGRVWLDTTGRTYLTADFTAGAAYIQGAPNVLGQGEATVPFAGFSAGLGF